MCTRITSSNLALSSILSRALAGDPGLHGLIGNVHKLVSLLLTQLRDPVLVLIKPAFARALEQLGNRRAVTPQI
jgi:hypothetical protein